MPNYRALKISRKHYKIYQAVLYLVVPYSQNYAARIHGLYLECSDCFEYPQKSLLRSRHPKKILPLSPSLEIRSTPPPTSPQSKDQPLAFDRERCGILNLQSLKGCGRLQKVVARGGSTVYALFGK